MNENEYISKIENCKSLKELFDIWEHKEPQTIIIGKRKKREIVINHEENFFIYDGIVCENKWNDKDSKKILFMLKESYTTDEEHDLMKWLRNGNGYIRMWKRITRWTCGLVNTTAEKVYDFDKAEAIKDGEGREMLKKIAVINLKKSNGKSSSDMAEVNAYASADKKEILKEIELIDPKIIVCGGTFDSLRLDVMYPHIEKKEQQFYRIKIAGKDRLVLDYKHPSCWGTNKDKYYGLMAIYQQALKNALKTQE